jgi:hypothetical protein
MRLNIVLYTKKDSGRWLFLGVHKDILAGQTRERASMKKVKANGEVCCE